MIRIVDYGMGNLRSVEKALETVGYSPEITDRAGPIRDADLLVLPGVGAFDRAVRNLSDEGLLSVIEDRLAEDRPFLGICLGFQLLFESSEEGSRDGFGYFGGTCRKFREVQPVPHMGWNEVDWQGIEDVHDPAPGRPQCYYFVHSYFPDPDDESVVAGVTEYGRDFCCAVRSGSVFGVQFHPEKSQYAGLNLLSNIVESVGLQSSSDVLEEDQPWK